MTVDAGDGFITHVDLGAAADVDGAHDAIHVDVFFSRSETHEHAAAGES